LPANDGSVLRQPTLIVLANGIPLAAPLASQIVSNNHHAADRFHVTAVLPAPPDAAMWAATAPIAIDIRIGLDGSPPVSLIQGNVDSVEIDALTGRLTIEGRDQTAALIEARTQETFANRTSSEIAALLAARHGLLPDVAPTTTPVGRYWQLEHDRITLDQFSRATTEWDLLTALAAHEGFDVWVSDTTLHFRPAASAAANPAPSATLAAVATAFGPANVTALRLERALTLAGAIQVTVKSWHSRMGTACVQSVSSGKGGSPRDYVYIAPNLTPDAALRLANIKLAELAKHERVVVAEMPGELTLKPRMSVAVAGTGTAFDQLYWIDEITRSLDWRHGFTQRIRARNVTAAAAMAQGG
jgi:phage protein D